MSKFEEYIKAREEIVNRLEGYFNGKEHIVLCSLYYCNNKHHPYSEIEQNGVTKYQEGCLMYNYVLAYLGYTFITENKEIPMEAGLKYSKAASYIKINSELISQIESSGPLENGKEGNVIEYMLAVYPGLREQMVSVFGSELINEERFPLKSKVQNELSQVKKIGETILARRKIESLTDDEVRKTYLGQVTLSLDSSIESCKREQTEILDNGSTPEDIRYRMLEADIDRLNAEKVAKEAEYTDIKTSKMREELLSAYVDYESEYNTYKKAQTTKDNLSKDTTISDELKLAKEKLEQRKAALTEAAKREKDNYTNTKILTSLEELMASDEWKTYFADSKNLQLKWADVLESMDKCNKFDVKLKDISDDEEKYEKLGFFAKRGEEGKALKEKISTAGKDELIHQKDEETINLNNSHEEHSKAKAKLTISIAALKEKVASLGLPGVGYFEGAAYISSEKLEEYYMKLKEQCQAAIMDNNKKMQELNDFKEVSEYSEAISEKIQQDATRVEELTAAAEVELNIEKKGQEYYDSIETAVELLNAAEAEAYSGNTADASETKSL